MYTAAQVVGNPSVKPPDVAAFEKVNFIPVTNYTGRANINIPIYSVSAGGMSVPISLSYNTSGVKVNSISSSVGTNWSLNAGGMITRAIKGMDDFHYPIYQNYDTGMSPSGWLGYQHPNVSVQGNVNRYNDAEPDIFNVSAPGLSTRYIHEKTFTTNSNGTVTLSNTSPDPIELEQRGNIINETIGLVTKSFFNDNTNSTGTITFFGLQQVKITGIDGVEYTFASPDASRHINGMVGIQPVIYKIESYRLDKMYNPSTKQTIDFEYEQFSNYFYDPTLRGGNSYGGGTNSGYQVSPSETTFPVTQRLKKISFDKGSVEFIYGSFREDNTGDKALTEIKIKDTNGDAVKHVKLAQSYFQSSIASTTAQSKRLRLDKIYEVDANLNELPGHTFTYNTSYEMPPRDSYAHDFLGYNNGSYSSGITNPIPKYYFKYNKLSPFYDASAIELTGNYSLASNLNYAKTYALTKVEYPTGGANEYEYELNEFDYYGLKQGGGLRIKSQKLLDDRGNTQILDYTYSNGNIAKMPTYAIYKLKSGSLGTPTTLSQLTNVLGIDTFTSPQSQVELTQGSFVGYKDVTVKNRINNGYTEFEYISPYPFTNVPSVKTSSSFSYNTAWKSLETSALSVDRDFLRGKPLTETIFTKTGKKRIYKKYVYSSKVFSTMQLSYLNKSTSDFACSNPSGSYKIDQSNCGSYTETIQFPIERHLLTSVIVEDYQSDKLTNTQGFDDLQHTIKTTKRYTYDLQYPLLLSESKDITVCEPMTQGGEQDCDYLLQDHDFKYLMQITYPLLGGSTAQGNTNSTLPFASQLITKNRLSAPLRIEFKNKDFQIIAKEDHIYKDFGSSLYALEKVNFIARDGTITLSDKITQRDNKGRVVEYLRKDGLYVARIYGYDADNYLVAEIVNSTYANAIYVLQNNLNTPFSEVAFSNDTSIRALMNELRVALPNTQIVSYTHKEMVGVNSITNARSRTVYYHFDAFNRLESVTDHEGKVVSKNSYHYKNQQ